MKLTPHERRAVAVAANCSEGAVARYLAGKTGRPSIRKRIETAMTAHGFGRVTRTAPAKRGATRRHLEVVK